MSPFSRSVFWELKKAEEKCAAVAASAEINPELLTLEGMVKIIFPNAASQTVRMLPAQGGAQQAGQKRPGEHNLHSTDLWDLPGGATGDQCFESLVKAKTLAKRAKESEAVANKKQREAARKEKHASANQLGAGLAAKIKSEADVKALKVDELKAVLTFKGVALDNKLKKADLLALLTREIDGNYASSFVASTSVEPEPTAADFIDSDDGSSSDSSEWAFSQADEED